MLRSVTAFRQLARGIGLRSNSTIAGTIYYRCNYHDPGRTAFLSPSEKIKWTYGDLWQQIMVVAGGLKTSGFQPGAVIATDLDYTSQSLLLQMAIAHEGMQVMTVKNEDEYKRLSQSVHVDGAVSSSGASFLQGVTFADLQKSGGKASEGATDRNYPLGFYGTDVVATNRQVYLHGVGMAGLLDVKPGVQVCIAASQQGVFGMGAMLAALVRSGVIYLPPVGSPDIGESEVLIADAEGAAALSGKAGPKLRDGLVKTGAYDEANGIPLVCGSSEVAGVRVHNLAAEGKHPLFDACSDTYRPIPHF